MRMASNGLGGTFLCLQILRTFDRTNGLKTGISQGSLRFLDDFH